MPPHSPAAALSGYSGVAVFGRQCFCTLVRLRLFVVLLAIGASACSEADAARLSRLEAERDKATLQLARAESTVVASRRREDWTAGAVTIFRQTYPDSQTPRRLLDAAKDAERQRERAEKRLLVAYRRQQITQTNLQNWLAGK